MRFLYKLCYAIGFVVAVIGALTATISVLTLGAFLLALPGIILVPGRIRLHLTGDDISHLDIIIEEYMSGFADLEQVKEELERVLNEER